MLLFWSLTVMSVFFVVMYRQLHFFMSLQRFDLQAAVSNLGGHLIPEVSVEFPFFLNFTFFVINRQVF